MAHSEDARRALRAAYVFGQLSLEVAALKAGVPPATARNWKRAARAAGDDWDRARDAQMIAGGGMEDVLRQTLGMMVQKVQATMQMLDGDPDIPPVQVTAALASLADSYNKLMNVNRRLMPETDKLAVAGDVVRRLADFTRAGYPAHAAALLEVLEPFGEELVKAYG